MSSASGGDGKGTFAGAARCDRNGELASSLVDGCLGVGQVVVRVGRLHFVELCGCFRNCLLLLLQVGRRIRLLALRQLLARLFD